MNYLGPGLDVTDHLIDKHFDKIPNKIFDKNTYKPGSRRGSRRNSEQQQLESRRNSQQQQEDSNSGSESEEQDQGREVREREDRDREPRRRRRERSKRGTREDDNPIPEVEEPDDIEEGKKESRLTRDIPRYSGQGQTQAYTYVAGPPGRQYDYPAMPLYSNEPPRYRPQYMPTPLPGQGYASPDRGRDRDYDSENDYYKKPARSSRRPKAVTRRSSSYHGPRDRHDYNNSYGSDDGEGQQMQHRRGSEAGTMAKAKDAGKRYALKEEVEDVLTTSTAGLAGSAVGAVVGGWAANKAQVAYGRDGRRRNESNPLLTLLGAAAGGLAVDVLVARFEDQKKEAKIKDKKWDKKFGDDREDRDGRRGNESAGRRGSESGRRRRRGSYSD